MATTTTQERSTMETTTTARYQVKRAYALNPTTGRATRQQIGWQLLRDGIALDLFRTRQQARDMRAYLQRRDAMEAARAARRAWWDALFATMAAIVAVVAFLVIVGLPVVPMDVSAAPARAMSPDVVQVVRALALPADVAFRALFID